MAFDEFSALNRQDVRKVEFVVPNADVECLRQLLDFKDFDPVKNILTMLKSNYGLKGVLRARRMESHQVLIQWLSRRQVYSEPGLYCVYKKDEWCHESIYQRAPEHIEEQQGTNTHSNTQPQAYVPGNLQCLFKRSAHSAGPVIMGAIQSFEYM